tara:strand:+ start:3218 stop:4849 length:1632 start_codon:yes stop_codon:yes gene_type:complete
MMRATIRKNRMILDMSGGDPKDVATARQLAMNLPSPAQITGGMSVQFTPAAAARLQASGLFKVSPAIKAYAKTFNETSGTPQAYEDISINYKTQPWTHQNDSVRFAYHKPASMLALEMGTGKSKVAVDLATNWGCKTILIVCPKSVLGVWRREFQRHGNTYQMEILESGTAARKAKQIYELLGDVADDEMKIVAVNYESLISKQVSEMVMSYYWDLVILDESHKIKSPTGKTSKFCAKLAEQASRRLCLTGTPMPHSPLDLFGQFRFLDAGIFGTAYARFRHRYAETHPMFPSKVKYWKNQDELNEIFSLISYRVKAEDVLDLPEAIHEEIRVTLCAKAQQIYRELQEQFVADVATGIVTTRNALTQLLRLQQVTSGFITDDNGITSRVDSAKAEALLTILDGLPETEPVVVFCRFRKDLEEISRLAESTGRRYGEISGDRKDLLTTGEMPDNVDLMAVQIQSGGVGIDLTRARICVYYSLGFSLGDYLQSLARCHRAGQDQNVIYYHLVGEHTVDERVYKALSNRRDVVEVIMNDITGANDG